MTPARSKPAQNIHDMTRCFSGDNCEKVTIGSATQADEDEGGVHEEDACDGEELSDARDS